VRQQGRQRARRSGFGRAALAANQHTADARVNRVQDQCALHAFLTNDGSKWIDDWHVFINSL
jgi:hypothetical protein